MFIAILACPVSVFAFASLTIVGRCSVDRRGPRGRSGVNACCVALNKDRKGGRRRPIVAVTIIVWCGAQFLGQLDNTGPPHPILGTSRPLFAGRHRELVTGGVAGKKCEKNGEVLGRG